MPTILRWKGYRFFFFSQEGHEPPRVHVERAECVAKVWLQPVAIARAQLFSQHELSRILRIVQNKRYYLLERWYGHFPDQV
ncbi:MAG: DUF4160 domain-containing protein [Acidobacteria bacterium]|nr:DUF4160 domain-containing protein [Acidobacteriota bacterium]